MQVNLRFGMHRDVELIHKEKGNIDGFVIPAHILAHQATSTSVFVTSLSGKPYVVDPMTYILQNPKNVHLNDSGELRPSVEKMCDLYHKDLSAAILALSSTGRLRAASFTDVKALCANVLKFQRTFVKDSSGTSAANKYIKRYSKTAYAEPRLFLPPYFCFNKVGDDWYKLSLSCANETKKSADNVAPVICCSPLALVDGGIDRIQSDYKQFDSVFLWMDNLAETTTPAPPIRVVRSLIKALVADETDVELLFGGYLAVLFNFDGATALSHGILYTQHKSTEVVPGGGGVPERYYIPTFHEFRSLSQTDLILHKHPELMCDCAVCKKVLKGNPDNIILFTDNPDLLRSHFLTVRRREADAIESASEKTVVANLRSVFKKYDASIRSLPNPDAIISASQMQGLQYLNEWADAFATKV
jgi:hypothetical protein